MAKKKFYAVKVGKVPGIYSTWSECEEQVKGFPSASYKSFTTLSEAENFMLDESIEKPDSDNGNLTEDTISTLLYNFINDTPVS